MESITVKLKYRGYKAILELKDKITVIRGLSATGKSTIHKILDINDESKLIDISNSRYKIQYVADKNIMNFIIRLGGFDKYTIYVIDEGKIKIDNEIASLIQKSEYAYFIITCRESLNKLNFSIDAVKQLVTDTNGVIRLSNYIQLRSQSEVELIQTKLDSIIIEDSGKAKQWFESLFIALEIELETPPGGKDEICGLIKSRIENCNNMLVIFDTCSFGSHIEELSSLLDSYPTRIKIVSYYKSWEYLMLKSNFYRDKMIEYSISCGAFEEKFYEEQLDKLSKQAGVFTHIKHDQGSKKSKTLSKCYTNACCIYTGLIRESDSVEKKCSIGLRGTDKFVSMLTGTEFENLLIIAKRGDHK